MSMKRNDGEISITLQEFVDKVFIAVYNDNRIPSGAVSKKSAGDLTLILMVPIDERKTLIISKERLESLGVNETEAWTIAKENTLRDVELSTMEDVLISLAGSEEEKEIITRTNDSSLPMYVLTNKEKKNGAAGIMVKEIAKKVHKLIGDFYILPSSIHEVICIQTETGYVDDFIELVRSVNDSAVAPNERLSYSIFKCENKNGIVTIA